MEFFKLIVQFIALLIRLAFAIVMIAIGLMLFASAFLGSFILLRHLVGLL